MDSSTSKTRKNCQWLRRLDKSVHRRKRGRWPKIRISLEKQGKRNVLLA